MYKIFMWLHGYQYFQIMIKNLLPNNQNINCTNGSLAITLYEEDHLTAY